MPSMDTIAPDAPAGLADGSIVNGVVNAANDTSSQALTGTAEADAVISVYDGATLLGTVSADGSGAWSYTLGHLADGAHSLTATATDAAGNTGAASSALSFTVDATAPDAPAGLGLASITAHSANLLTNGSFETGSWSGWTQAGNTAWTTVETGAPGPQDGTYFLQGGPSGSDGLLSQTFSDTPGQTLTLSAWVTSDGSSPSV